MAQKLAPSTQANNSSRSLRLTTQKIHELLEILPAAKIKDNLMDLNQFHRLMQSATQQQKDLLLHILNHILNPDLHPLQVFFITGPAGCGKTFIVKFIKEIYNRFAKSDGHFNNYIICAPTSQAALAINGNTLHKAFKINFGQLLPLSNMVLQQYRVLFQDVRVIIIDEVNMVGVELLNKIHHRLQQITGNFDVNFGGLDIIVIGDFRQLPPVNETPIYMHPSAYRHLQMAIRYLWQDFKVFELTQSVRQENQAFANLLTKIGNGDILNEEEAALIESRFFTKERANELCPNGIRIFRKMNQVDFYNIATGPRARIINNTQGETLDQIVYEYNKNHPLSLVYLVLSRVRTMEGLHIITENDDLCFYHCRKNVNSANNLKLELQRLSFNKLPSIDPAIMISQMNKLFLE